MKHKGFTLIEFIVIISIFSVMASVALFNFNGFRSNVGLNNLAHDIGLTIRQAQVFGWATQSASSSGSLALDSIDPVTGNPIRYADGVYFDMSSPKQFVLYRKLAPDVPENYINPDDIVVDTIKVNGPNKIGAIGYASNKGDLLLTAAGLPSGSPTLVMGNFSIAFSRPKPEAIFFEGPALIASPNNYAAIYIQGDRDVNFSHVIIVSRTGEIDVQ